MPYLFTCQCTNGVEPDQLDLPPFVRVQDESTFFHSGSYHIARSTQKSSFNQAYWFKLIIPSDQLSSNSMCPIGQGVHPSCYSGNSSFVGSVNRAPPSLSREKNSHLLPFYQPAHFLLSSTDLPSKQLESVDYHLVSAPSCRSPPSRFQPTFLESSFRSAGFHPLIDP